MTSTLRQRLSAALRRLPWLYQPLQRGYRRLVPAPHPLEAEIRAALRNLDRVHFVQVGSNDGTQGDPLHRLLRRDRRWRGLFIEPVGFLFERLRQNYAGDARFDFANVAIAAEPGSAAFYYVSEQAKAALGERLPYWYDQLGSFDRQHIVKHLDGLLEPYIVETALPCLPLQSVLDQHRVDRIDVLHIDTEGYDWQVLRMFDLQRYRPSVVLYEHKHLSPDDRQQARQRLKDAGYSLRTGRDDTLGLRPS
ncbi:FkbM family methyltransferase [Stagnimonas aquatica]|uniref:FkbM family methyltransferase n=1 Tax=Stagnimonas aquatica TaxID=2689987 RepID=A0A3N0VGY7_9GAMM|nr:FkbM family methyltransferase [Stagnimonas aquatica]ROH92027.1 FkbM family methyltransferase [Stagnimonas aquatica]